MNGELELHRKAVECLQVSAERQAQEIARIIIERDDARQNYQTLLDDAVEMRRQIGEIKALHVSIIDQGRKVLNATSDIGMSCAEYIEWAIERLEGK